MNILWVGGEDTEFPTMGTMTVVTTAGRFRSTFARAALSQASNTSTSTKSIPFNGGAVTSAWLSAQLYGPLNIGTATSIIGFGLSGTEKWLGIGTSTASNTRLCIFKYDGTTRTQLVAEAGNSLIFSALIRVDMQVISYGATATVNLYVNSVLVATYTGDVTVSGMTNFDSVFALFSPTGGSSNLSEMFVADSDTRTLIGLQTLALTGAGTTNNWTNNTYTNINGTTISDASPTYINTTTTNQQYDITDPTSSAYSVVACVISARIAKSAGSTPSNVKLGYNNSGTIAFGTGASKAATTSYATYQQIDATNPITSNPFLQSEMNALQINLQSA
jgi:hypothetical protein